MQTEQTALAAWIDQQWGRQSELAKQLGVTKQSVFYWAKSAPPPSRCWQIEQITGIKVEELNSSVQWVRVTKKGPPVFVPKPRPARMSSKAQA